MILSHHKYFEELKIIDNESNYLIIENSIYFREILNELDNQIKNSVGDFFLSDNNNSLSLSKCCILLTSFYDLDNFTKMLKTKVTQEITNYLYEDELSIELLQTISKFSNLAENTVRYPIRFKDEITLLDIMKMLDLSIDYEGMTLVESLLQFMQMCHEALNIRLFITANLSDYMSSDELKEFFKEISMNEITLLMIERHNNDVNDINKKIIDQDLCMI